jgi:hypothetical protein
MFSTKSIGLAIVSMKLSTHNWFMDVIKIKDREGVVHELQVPPIWLWILWNFVKRMNSSWRNLWRNYVRFLPMLCFEWCRCQKWMMMKRPSEAFYVKSNSRLVVNSTTESLLKDRTRVGSWKLKLVKKFLVLFVILSWLDLPILLLTTCKMPSSGINKPFY